jgi:hypothetical protein
MCRLRSSLRQLHPAEFDCLPMPPLRAPDSAEQLAKLLREWQQNLTPVNDVPTPWIRARWACPHLPSLVIEDVWSLLYAWYQVLMVAGRDRDEFDAAIVHMAVELNDFDARYAPQPVRWWLAYDAGSAIAQRARKHGHVADPADRNPFRNVDEPALRYWWNRGRRNNPPPVDDYGQVPAKLTKPRYCCPNNMPPQHPRLVRAYPTVDDLATYEADRARWAAQVAAKRERANSKPPMASGFDLGDGRFFCGQCWKAGVEDGAHEVNQPPCELPTSPTAGTH